MSFDSLILNKKKKIKDIFQTNGVTPSALQAIYLN